MSVTLECLSVFYICVNDFFFLFLVSYDNKIERLVGILWVKVDIKIIFKNYQLNISISALHNLICLKFEIEILPKNMATMLMTIENFLALSDRSHFKFITF